VKRFMLLKTRSVFISKHLDSIEATLHKDNSFACEMSNEKMHSVISSKQCIAFFLQHIVHRVSL